MCNLYSIKTNRAALARKFLLSENRMAAFEPLPAIFPGHMAPIIKQSADGERELVMRSWGFILLRDGFARMGEDRADACAVGIEVKVHSRGRLPLALPEAGK